MKRTSPLILMIVGGLFLAAGALSVLLAVRGQTSLLAVGLGFLAVGVLFFGAGTARRKEARDAKP